MNPMRLYRKFPRSNRRWEPVVAIIAMLGMSAPVLADQVQASAGEYLRLLQNGLEGVRRQMPLIVQSAEPAAQRLIAGGHLYSGGPQADFAAEANGRSGGLMGMKPLAGASPARGDVVLYARTGPAGDEDEKVLAKFKADGAYVVAFMPQSADRKLSCDVLIDTGEVRGLALGEGAEAKICPVDSLINVSAMWTWTAELTAACTRHGKMPVLYESYGMPNGRERDTKYQGQMFHQDMQVPGVSAQTLGNAYLDSLAQSLKKIETEQRPAILTAAQWLRQAPADQAYCRFIGHMFPVHFQDPRAPLPMKLESSPIDGPDKLDINPGGYVLFVGYQQAPQKLVDQARAEEFHLVYMSVSRAANDSADNIRYINPEWDLPDAAVRIEGYDIPIFPPSGVLDAAIYWSIVAESH